MTVRELLKANRSYRRFHQDLSVTRQTLVELVELTRLCPSAANLQPLKYLAVSSAAECDRVFPHLRWAAALRDWPGPAADERPTGYIIILGDTQIATNFHVDHGIAAQSMLLGAVERGLGGCIIESIDRPGLRQALKIPERFEILLVLALGRPKEKVVLEDARSPEDVTYWRDAEGVHHVPKRPLSELLLELPEENDRAS